LIRNGVWDANSGSAACFDTPVVLDDFVDATTIAGMLASNEKQASSGYS